MKQCLHADAVISVLVTLQMHDISISHVALLWSGSDFGDFVSFAGLLASPSNYVIQCFVVVNTMLMKHINSFSIMENYTTKYVINWVEYFLNGIEICQPRTS